MNASLIRYVVSDLPSAREFLKQTTSDVELINADGTIRYYGILVINYIFTQLQKEFSHVKKVTYNLEQDPIAYDTAKKMGIIVNLNGLEAY